ncbi:MAG: NUDIX hydrolase [Peptostreptococcaceae bacterium]
MVEEKTISSDRVYTGKTISLKVDTVEVPKRGYQKREIVEHNGAVGIIAITPENKVVLVKQYRKAIEKELLEIPAGKIEIGENPKECAIRELKEETGYSAGNIRLIHKFYTSAGFSNQKIYIFLAEDLVDGEQNLEQDEFLQVEKYDINEVYNMIIKNEIEDAKTSIAMLLIKELL